MNHTKNDVKSIAHLMAKLYYFITAEVIENFGEEGKDVIKRALKKYGSHRGKLIRERVDQAGLEPNFVNMSENFDAPLGEAWIDEGIITEDTYRAKITYCPFAETWKQMNAQDIGIIYCEQDEALMTSFNQNVQFTRPKNMQKNHECCLFDVKIKK